MPRVTFRASFVAVAAGLGAIALPLVATADPAICGVRIVCAPVVVGLRRRL